MSNKKNSVTKLFIIMYSIVVFCIVVFTFFYQIPQLRENLIAVNERQSGHIANHYVSEYLSEVAVFNDITIRPFVFAVENYFTFNIWKVKLFDNTGQILYSTLKSEIGQTNNHDYFHNQIANGVFYSKLTKKGEMTIENEEVDINIVETYVPVFSNNKFIGAFEIYLIVDKELKEIKNTLFLSLIFFMILMSFVGVFIYAISRIVKGIEYGRQSTLEKLHDVNLQLSINEKKYKTLFDQSIMPFVIIEDNYTIVKYNNAFEALLNNEEEKKREILTFNSFFDKHNMKIINEEILRCGNNDNYKYEIIEVCLKKENNKFLIVELLTKQIFYDGNKKFLISLNDITERRKKDDIYNSIVQAITGCKEQELFDYAVSSAQSHQFDRSIPVNLTA